MPACVFQCLGRRRSDLAVERHRGFERYQGNAVTDVARESFVQLTRGLLAGSDLHFHSCGAQRFEASSADFWIRIGHAMRLRDGYQLGSGRRCREAVRP